VKGKDSDPMVNINMRVSPELAERIEKAAALGNLVKSPLFYGKRTETLGKNGTFRRRVTIKNAH
jgi:hypothetical protein